MTEYPSETAKYRHLTRHYCWRQYPQDPLFQEPGVGVDIASQGDPVVPWAVQFDLPAEEFAHYNSNHAPQGPIQLRGHADKLPFDSSSLDFVYSSHLLEDFLDWTPILTEWTRVLKPGGHLIILVPDKVRWNEAILKGQPPNCAHTHESHAGELSTYADGLGLEVIEDRLTDLWEGDYSVLYVAKKKA